MTDPIDVPGWPLPPPPATGIRGADNRTLTDLYNLQWDANLKLDNIYGQLQYASERLYLIETHLFRLVGTPESVPLGWSGLPSYLHNRLFPADGSEGANSINEQLIALITRATVMHVALFGEYPPGEADVLGTILAALTEGNIYTSSTAGKAAELLDAIGPIDSGPELLSVKTILEFIRQNTLRAAECCEEGEGPTDPPDNGQNPEPMDVSCDVDEYPYLRNTGWASISPPLLDNQPGLEGWAPLFDTVGPHFDGDLVRDPPAFGSGIEFSAFVNANTGYTVCLKWDFTGNTVPQFANFYRFGDADFYLGGETPNSIAPLNVPVGGFIQSLDAGIRWVPVFYTEAGSGPPGLNLWLTVQFGPS